MARRQQLRDPRRRPLLLEPQLGVRVDLAGELGERGGLRVDGIIDGSGEVRVERHAGMVRG